MYAIAESFPIEARRLAASRIYVPTDRGNEWHAYKVRLTTEGCCPLGVILHQISTSGDMPYNRDSPQVHAVAFILNLKGMAADQDEQQLLDNIESFVIDWDSGAITDLAEALGVDREATL